jgi:type IV pilus assembly protein PilN
MIRINLIPVPKVRKQERLIMEAVVAAVAVVLVTIVCYWITGEREKAISKLEYENTTIRQQIQQLEARVGQVEKFRQQQETVRSQLEVIRSLEAGRTGPVRMMDELTEIIPRQLWINSFREQSQAVTMQGLAADGPVIADFMDSLKQSKYFLNPELQSVTAQDQDGVRLQRFTITTRVNYGG